MQKRSMGQGTYLVRKGQGELDLVGHSLGIASALERNAEGRGASPQSRTGKTKRVHIATAGSEGGDGGERIEVQNIEVGSRLFPSLSRDMSNCSNGRSSLQTYSEILSKFCEINRALLWSLIQRYSLATGLSKAK